MKRLEPSAAARVRRLGRFAGHLLAAAILLAGLTITMLTAGGLRTVQRQNADRVMDQRTAVARAAISTETDRYRTLLQATAAGVSTDARFTAADFAAAILPLEAAQLLGATSVGFAVATPHDRVAADQDYWRKQGAAGLLLAARGEPDEHFFSIFARSLVSSEPSIAGSDIAASPEAAAALAEARRTGRPAVSDTYVLLVDRHLPVDRQQLSFVFVAPIYTPGDKPDFVGWMMLGVRGQDFLGGVLGAASQGQLDGELLATNMDGRQVEVASYSTHSTRDLQRQATLQVANRQWTLVTGADSMRLPGARSGLPLTVLLGGLTLTILLAWLVQVLVTGRSRAREQVLIATAELRCAEAESRRQAGLLGAIMDSLSDGVGVVDANGEFLLHNPAARTLLGIADDIAGPDDWQQHYGLYRPDGRTPFPVEEMPLVRALRGESSNGVEMVIRNSGRPDGLLISIKCRPLDASAGQIGAVAIFHDITELRRHETDLSVFAGVVAHDLKAPLALISGHGEAAAEDLAEALSSPSVAAARVSLVRIADAVDRMAGLIDTLLAYTTSRDAPLRRRTVALGLLVDDVVAGRIGGPRPDAGPSPEIYVGPLPDVDADPAMLRHVLDNLIGNALKYVPAGRPARIDVTASDASDGWAQVEIADRGIGIPDDDKPNVFESFHRARTAAAYVGTGLGLAICRRIVERHGGTIGVADNPGGGTRIHFTLPFPAHTAEVGDQAADHAAGQAALDRAVAARAQIESSAVSLSPATGTEPRCSEPSAVGDNSGR